MNASVPDPDDREEDVDPEEIDVAGERTPNHPAPPEIPEKMEALTEWDRPLDAAGSQAHKVLPEDEVNIAEELVEEGVEEADRDQRLASSDPDFEP
jgi:hypothetical protein